jgi:hypothetical protein
LEYNRKVTLLSGEISGEAVVENPGRCGGWAGRVTTDTMVRRNIFANLNELLIKLFFIKFRLLIFKS